MQRVTGILAACGFREWPKSIPQADREWYLQRGTAIHKATALLDNCLLDWSTVDSRIEGFVRGYELFRAEVGGDLLLCEHPVESKRYGYCGRLDRVYGPSRAWRGRLLCDIKTNEADVYTRLQDSGYKLALGWKVKRGAVSLFADGSYHLYVYDNDAGDDAAWLHCVGLARWVGANAAPQTRRDSGVV